MASTSPLSAGSYSGTPASLPRDVLAALAERRRTASRAFEQALAKQQAGASRIDAQTTAQLSGLSRRLGRDRHEGMSQLAAAGRARSPRQAGRFLRGMRDQEVEQRGQLGQQRADQLRALDVMVNEARRTRDREHAGVDADKARHSTELDRLFEPNYGGLR